MLAHSAGGGGTASLRVFPYRRDFQHHPPYRGARWWDGSPAGRRAVRHSTDWPAARRPPAWFTIRCPPGFSLHQTDVDLSVGPNAGKRIERLEFTRANGAGDLHPGGERR